MDSFYPTKSASSFPTLRSCGNEIRLVLGQYIDWMKHAAERALEREEVVLISVYPVCHGE
jgi:hypothetical protein